MVFIKNSRQNATGTWRIFHRQSVQLFPPLGKVISGNFLNLRTLHLVEGLRSMRLADRILQSRTILPQLKLLRDVSTYQVNITKVV